MKANSRRIFIQKAGLAALGTAPLLAEPERKKDIFVHHVFFYLKDPNNAQNEAKLLEGLEKLAEISVVKFSHIGRPARTDGGDIEKGYSVSWLCFFKNLIEEEIYQTDPAHLAFLEEYGDLWEKRVVYDSLGRKVW
ncbi:Dabb family protein [Persicitalea sp.]|uniref:Dabb family protein n=1 Tax=Persicitalea sp. TaxID=3100273 RepID=UPI0035946FFC